MSEFCRTLALAGSQVFIGFSLKINSNKLVHDKNKIKNTLVSFGRSFRLTLFLVLLQLLVGPESKMSMLIEFTCLKSLNTQKLIFSFIKSHFLKTMTINNTNSYHILFAFLAGTEKLHFDVNAPSRLNTLCQCTCSCLWPNKNRKLLIVSILVQTSHFFRYTPTDTFSL